MLTPAKLLCSEVASNRNDFMGCNLDFLPVETALIMNRAGWSSPVILARESLMGSYLMFKMTFIGSGLPTFVFAQFPVNGEFLTED